MTRCAECGAWVKDENLVGHYGRNHVRVKPPEGAPLAKRPLRLTRKGKALASVTSALILSVVAVSLLLDAPHPTQIAVGSSAPDFTLATSDGGSQRLSSLEGRPVLLEFMSPFCPFCVDQAPVLSSLYQAYSDRVFFLSVVLVNFPDGIASDSSVNAFRETHGTPWPYAMDTGTNAASFGGPVTYSYSVIGTPTTFILDAHGTITWIGRGLESYASLEGAMP